MRRPRAVPEPTQLSFLAEPVPSNRRRARRAEERPLSPAESLHYCNALLAEIDRVARLEKEHQEARVLRIAALYEAAVAHHGDRASEERATSRTA